MKKRVIEGVGRSPVFHVEGVTYLHVKVRPPVFPFGFFLNMCVEDMCVAD
jgi:hypothetical protein